MEETGPVIDMTMPTVTSAHAGTLRAIPTRPASNARTAFLIDAIPRMLSDGRVAGLVRSAEAR